MTSVAAVNRKPRYCNPVFPEYFADPFVWWHDGVAYAVGTGAHSAPEGWEFRILRSTNLVDWEPAGYALRVPPGFQGGSFWAPEVSHIDGRFCMVYSVGIGDKGHRIRLATSLHPEGPYEDIGPITPPDLPFAIDPHIYQHNDGHRYLYYAADRLEGDRPGTCLWVDRLIAPAQLAGQPRLVAEATSDWQRFERDREIYGQVLDWHTLEGPCATFHEGKVYVLYSGGNWQNETYGVDFVVADHPLGPYTNGTLDGPRCMRTVPGQVLGPGHNSLTTSSDGAPVIVYHAWDPQRSGRLMRIDPLLFGAEGPFVDGPSYEERELP